MEKYFIQSIWLTGGTKMENALYEKVREKVSYIMSEPALIQLTVVLTKYQDELWNENKRLKKIAIEYRPVNPTYIDANPSIRFGSGWVQILTVKGEEL